MIIPEISSVFSRLTQTEQETRLPLPMLLRSFLGMLVGFIITKNALGEHTPPELRENALQQFMDVYLYGILPRGSDD